MAAVALLAGCYTRSISDSDYRGGRCGRPNPFYRGELSEFDLLGIERGASITEEQIGRALDHPMRVQMRGGSTLLLVQSGAYQPDDPMRIALQQRFKVVPFTGQPGPTNGQSYARALRLAAAQAGCETIACYWGTLESARKDLPTQSVTWVPVVGWAIPKESQRMRIRLKVALVDVRTGYWAQFSPPAFEDSAIMDRGRGDSSDQSQVEKLKRLAYESAAVELARTYSFHSGTPAPAQ
jgi:hypothetical protein